MFGSPSQSGDSTNIVIGQITHTLTAFCVDFSFCCSIKYWVDYSLEQNIGC